MNTKGTFSLNNYVLTDSIKVSSLGYKSEKVLIKSLVNNPIVYLVKAPIALNEVAVSVKQRSIKFHRQRIGWFNDRVNTFINLNRLCIKKGSRIVVWVENRENQVGIIEGLVVKLLARQDTKNPKPIFIRVCVLSGNKIAGPNQDASITPTLFKVEPGGQTLHIDLQKNQLYLPAQGGFVGIEWLDNAEDNLPVCVALTNSDMSINDMSNTWQSYRGKNWVRFGVGHGSDGRLRRFNNSNARVDAIIAFPDK